MRNKVYHIAIPIFLGLMCYKHPAFAQNRPQDELLVEIADSAYSFGGIQLALDQYAMAAQLNPNNITAQYMAGICELKGAHKNKALPYFEKAMALDSVFSRSVKLPQGIFPDLIFLTGYAYNLIMEFDKAIELYQIFLQNIPVRKCRNETFFKRERVTNHVIKRIEDCKRAKIMVANPTGAKIIELKMVNSEWPDYGPMVTADGNTLIFTSRRNGGLSMDVDRDLVFFEDIYKCTKNPDGTWSAPKLFPDINTKKHESALSVSGDGNTILLYEERNQGDIYISTFDEKKQGWNTPKPIGDNINSPDLEKSASISTDKKYLFFSSQRRKGFGGLDIYFSKAWGENWKTPINVGEVINTPGNEDSPYYIPETRTLYFASDGHKGMGGYDIYKTVYNPATQSWSEPENLGYPINSPDDENTFVPLPDGTGALFSTVKPDGTGGTDIYLIKFK